MVFQAVRFYFAFDPGKTGWPHHVLELSALPHANACNGTPQNIRSKQQKAAVAASSKLPVSAPIPIPAPAPVAILIPAAHGGSNWSQKFWGWLARIQLEPVDQCVLDVYVDLIHYLEAQIRSLETCIEKEAHKPRFQEPVRLLKAFRGIATITALTLACELGDIRRFEHPRQLIGYLRLVPSENTSANKTHRGAITRAGNRDARKALVSAAWKYAARPTRSHSLKQPQQDVDPHVVATSWKAQQRLYKRFDTLAIRRSVAAVTIARELSGFLWDAMNTLTPTPALQRAA